MKKSAPPIPKDQQSGRARQPRKPLDQAYLRLIEATLSEWASDEDAAAYDDLQKPTCLFERVANSTH